MDKDLSNGLPGGDATGFALFPPTPTLAAIDDLTFGGLPSPRLQPTTNFATETHNIYGLVNNMGDLLNDTQGNGSDFGLGYTFDNILPRWAIGDAEADNPPHDTSAPTDPIDDETTPDRAQLHSNTLSTSPLQHGAMVSASLLPQPEDLRSSELQQAESISDPPPRFHICAQLLQQINKREGGWQPKDFKRISVTKDGNLFETFDQRYIAMKSGRKDADRHFICRTTTTNICCRPSCASKKPERHHIDFIDIETFHRNLAAIKDKSKPCKRCWPWIVDTPAKGKDGEPAKGKDGKPDKGNDAKPGKGKRRKSAKGKDREPAKGNEGKPAKGKDREPAKGNDGKPATGKDDKPAEKKPIIIPDLISRLIKDADKVLLEGAEPSPVLTQYSNETGRSISHICRKLKESLLRMPGCSMCEYYQIQHALDAARYKHDSRYEGIDWQAKKPFNMGDTSNKIIGGTNVHTFEQAFAGLDVFYVAVEHGYLGQACVVFCADVLLHESPSSEEGASSKRHKDNDGTVSVPVAGTSSESTEPEGGNEEDKIIVEGGRKRKSAQPNPQTDGHCVKPTGDLRPAVLSVFVGNDAEKLAKEFAPHAQRDSTFEVWLKYVVELMHYSSTKEETLPDEQFTIVRRARLLFEAIRFFVPEALSPRDIDNSLDGGLVRQERDTEKKEIKKEEAKQTRAARKIEKEKGEAEQAAQENASQASTPDNHEAEEVVEQQPTPHAHQQGEGQATEHSSQVPDQQGEPQPDQQMVLHSAAQGIPQGVPQTGQYFAQPMMQPMMQPMAQPMMQPTTQPMMQSMAQPMMQSMAQPMFQSMSQQTDPMMAQPMTQQTGTMMAQPMTQQTVPQMAQFMSQPALDQFAQQAFQQNMEQFASQWMPPTIEPTMPQYVMQTVPQMCQQAVPRTTPQTDLQMGQQHTGQQLMGQQQMGQQQMDQQQMDQQQMGQPIPSNAPDSDVMDALRRLNPQQINDLFEEVLQG